MPKQVAIPEPTDNKPLFGATVSMLAVPLEGRRHVVYYSDECFVRLSIADQDISSTDCGRLIKQSLGIGRSVVTVDLICGNSASMHDVRNYANQDETSDLLAAIPYLYAAVREAGGRAGLRAIYRHLSAAASTYQASA